ncbi:MAG: peptidoglycan DD-metalloendopeptidase family protein [Desulfuromusa sp.]|jgi:murein DD-endopeptidase MepM/ murein hydrolase activator NlpD|nr:peptidoglycan DD-metalloendopeptidase family protein [Desulfuromusa sp.]
MILKKDFQPPRGSVSPSKIKSKVRQMVVLTALVLFVGVGLLLLSSGPSAELAARETPVVISTPAALPAPPEPVREEIKNSVPAGSSITALLGNYFTAQEIYNLNQQSRKIFPFTKIIAGQPYRICTIDGQFSSFIYEIDAEEQLVISREAEQINMERQPIIYNVTTELIQGTIKTSLFNAISEINEEPELAYVLADIFGWDINFILDLRVGDTFQALVEKRFREGQPAGYGHVLAAEFVNQNKVFKAIRFKEGEQKVSFYNEKGENMRKVFLKAPLSFTRISSGYTMRRLHPISKVWKAHPAIDYAAPIGTPVKTVGDGSISRKGYGKGNGHYLEVVHSNGYKTMYLHLKGFAKGIVKGKRVSQGQVIGYVGSSGLSTGPHLDFRMKRHGKPINPLKLKAPPAKSLSKEYMAEFKTQATPLLAQLDEKRINTHFAKLDLPQTENAVGKSE